MTRSLRQRHRRVMLVLAVLLPLLFLVGLRARRPLPVMPGDTAPLAAGPMHDSSR